MFEWSPIEIEPGETTYPLCITSTAQALIIACPNAIWRSTDGGDTFTRARLGGRLGNWPRGAWADPQGLVSVVGDGAEVQVGIVTVSVNHGESFSVHDAGTSAPMHSVTGRGDELWAVGTAGVVFHSTDRGQTWTNQQPAGAVWLRDIWTDPDGSLWITGSNGTVLRSSDGRAWSVVRQKGSKLIFGVRRSSDGTLFAPSGGGTLFRSNDGESWTAKRTKTKAWFRAGMERTGDDLWIGGDEDRRGRVWHNPGDGKEWTPVELPEMGYDVASMHATSDDELWVASGEFLYRGRRA